MNKKLLSLLIGVICLSLSGIIVVQFFWIRNAISVKEAQFDRSVNDAMGAAVNAIEMRDNFCYLGNTCVRDSVRNVFKILSDDSLLEVDPHLDSLIHKEQKDHPSTSRGGITMTVKHNNQTQQGHVTSYMDTVFANMIANMNQVDQNNQGFNWGWSEDELQKMDSMLRTKEMSLPNEILDVQTIDQPGMNTHVIVRYSLNPLEVQPQVTTHIAKPSINSRDDQVRKLNRKVVKMQNVIKKMTLEMETKPRPFDERINKSDLGHLLKRTFSDKDINQPFDFAVTTLKDGKTEMPVHSDGFLEEHLKTQYRVSLFPNDLFEKNIMLLVHFPGQSKGLFKSLSWLIIFSIFLTLILVLTSGTSIFVMLRQKKISDIKTDFINNMTHEFKTPIATISIAVDSINNPKVIAQPEIIRNYTKVIKEENNRMNTRVEQVLQMALLDSSEFRLSQKPVNMNDLVKRVTDNIRLQTENRQGRLDVSMEAEKTTVFGDESHLTNVVMSLLDNAIKYSPDHPQVQVSTINLGNSVVISVEDHGIGMNPETRNRIFDKFFRVTTGNIHNIKGFGLGLSYAKAIILAHNGEIRVTSEPGVGSKFEVVLPLLT